MRLEKRILVVDDDDAIRALVSTVLRRRGLHVDHARSGAEALERLAEYDYALVILDLTMPRMSGYEVLEQSASMDPRPLVLALTSGAHVRPFPPDVVVGTIQKPFDVELLVDTVTGCLSATTRSARPAARCAVESSKLARPSEDVN